MSIVMTGTPSGAVAVPDAAAPATSAGGPPSAPAPARVRGGSPWVLVLLAAPAFVAIWSGWVGLGELTGFGVVRPLPGIADSVTLNTAITLPVGVETYAAYALRVWLAADVPARARVFARWSALGSLLLGAAGQVAYHLMTAAGITRAPWQITAAVACLPVAVLGMGAALAHLVRHPAPSVQPVPVDTAAAPGTAPGAQAGRAEARGPAARAAGAGTTGVGSAPAGDRSRGGAGPVRKPGSGTAERVARLRQRHPQMSAVDIARRVGVTDRTVRRYLAAAGAAAGAGAGTQVDGREGEAA